jgi:hypothetical protein
MLNQKKKVRVTFETGSQFVEQIDLIYRDTQNLNVYTVESFNKADLGILDNNVHDFDFSNNKIYRALPNSQLTRLFDNVPLKAKAQEILGRNLIFGNYEHFYDIVDSSGTPIKIDIDVSHVNRWWVPDNKPLNTFRSDRDYEVGIQYGDSDGRFTTVLTSEKNDTYIEPIYSVTSNSLLVKVKNDPPDFATRYRLLIKQAKKKYYTIFPILYYTSGMYRYFLVNDFDLDKIKVGEYLIFKSDNNGPVQNDKKYKVLELENKGTNFLNLNNIDEIPGLYFKIKVEDQSEFSQGALTKFNATRNGGNAPLTYIQGNQTVPFDTLGAIPFRNRSSFTDSAIHYGDGPEFVLTAASGYFLDRHLRFTVEIISQTQFRYTSVVSEGSGWVTSTITPGIPQGLLFNGLLACFVTFAPQSYYFVGDKWKINCRGDGHLTLNALGGVGLPKEYVDSDFGDWGGGAILPGPGWGEADPITGLPDAYDKEIKSGAVIRIKVIEDRHNSNQQEPQQVFPPSPRDYANIEEWFYESGAYDDFIHYDLNGNDAGGKAVTFYRAMPTTQLEVQAAASCYNDYILTYKASNVQGFGSVQMVIQGFGTDDGINVWNQCNKHNVVRVSIDIQQQENLSVCETVPEESDIDIFHETTRTYPIENGKHKVTWSYQDFTAPNWATIDGTGYTNLGQTDPEGDPDNTDGIEPHYFQVGDFVDVVCSTPGQGVYTTAYIVLHVHDKYNIVVNQDWLGNGPVTPGTVGFHHDQAGEVDQIGSGAAQILINHTNKYDIYNTDGTLKVLAGGGIDISESFSGNTNSTYNAYTFGNGVESNRVRDHFNATTLEYSPRSSTVIENYEKERKESSLTYSGVFKSDTSVNGFNEFNLSLVNFKNLDVEFGSIQKLFSRDTNLVVFQEDKVSKILYSKNLLSDSAGGGQITSVKDVLGTQISNPGEWGISFNPESFAQWGPIMFWTDSRRGSVLTMIGDEIQKPISDQGMKDYFRDLFRNNPNTRKLGAYDPRKNHYVLASNEDTSKPCFLDLVVFQSEFPASSNTGIEYIPLPTLPHLAVVSNTDWTTSIVYSAGSGWVTGIPSSGFGDENIYIGLGDNDAPRTATVTFTYCDGLTADYVITQGSGNSGNAIIWVIGTAPVLLEPYQAP